MIENAVVDKPFRGKGVGGKLFEAAIAWAVERGLRYVQTTVWHDNTGAMEFYVDHGFRPMTVRLELDTERSQERGLLRTALRRRRCSRAFSRDRRAKGFSTTPRPRGRGRSVRYARSQGSRLPGS